MDDREKIKIKYKKERKETSKLLVHDVVLYTQPIGRDPRWIATSYIPNVPTSQWMAKHDRLMCYC